MWKWSECYLVSSSKWVDSNIQLKPFIGWSLLSVCSSNSTVICSSLEICHCSINLWGYTWHLFACIVSFPPSLSLACLKACYIFKIQIIHHVLQLFTALPPGKGKCSVIIQLLISQILIECPALSNVLESFYVLEFIYSRFIFKI